MLAVCMALIIVWAQRVGRLPEIQMEFVAGVSHALRTLLAVIRSAADNLADGVVGEKQKVQEYGALIRGQGHRLSEIVDQVLIFAARKVGRTHCELCPVKMGEVVDAVLAGTNWLVTASRFIVEKMIPPGLPPVLADPTAL